MSWQGQTTTIIRHLISDVDPDDYTFTDRRLETTALVAAQLTTFDVDFTNDYEINVEACTLSPDPTDTATKDNAFLAIICLRSACIIIGSEIRKESGNAISIKDGPSSINLTGVTGTLITLYKDLCKKYEETLFQYRSGSSVAGQAILTPYSPGSDLYGGGSDHRSGGSIY